MYESGLLVALLVWAYVHLMIIVRANSRLASNLRRVGYTLGWATGQPQPMSAKDRTRGFLMTAVMFAFIAVVGLVLVALSWLYVAMFAGQMLYSFFKDRGAPASVREYRWKLRNLDLSQDDIIREMMKLKDIPAEDFDRIRLEIVSGTRAAV